MTCGLSLGQAGALPGGEPRVSMGPERSTPALGRGQHLVQQVWFLSLHWPWCRCFGGVGWPLQREVCPGAFEVYGTWKPFCLCPDKAAKGHVGPGHLAPLSLGLQGQPWLSENMVCGGGWSVTFSGAQEAMWAGAGGCPGWPWPALWCCCPPCSPHTEPSEPLMH